jgi:hypothetical protein
MSEPTVTVSIAFKRNLGNYESVDHFASISGLKAGATPAEIDALLDTGRVAWERIRLALAEQIRKGRPE